MAEYANFPSLVQCYFPFFPDKKVSLTSQIVLSSNYCRCSIVDVQQHCLSGPMSSFSFTCSGFELFPVDLLQLRPLSYATSYVLPER